MNCQNKQVSIAQVKQQTNVVSKELNYTYIQMICHLEITLTWIQVSTCSCLNLSVQFYFKSFLQALKTVFEMANLLICYHSN